MLAIARADRPAHLEGLRAMVARSPRRERLPPIDLALVHAGDVDVPRGSAAWAWLRDHARIHHVRAGERRDYERIARTMVRCGVAVVLSGGGARGIAHVGVLRALEEAGVPVDAIGGASMGGLVAAGYARGWDAGAILDRMRRLFRRSGRALYDPTLPFVALLAGRKLERVLRRYFEDLAIEDLWLPFFCVSTDLGRAAVHVHDRGALWRAVAASCSIPGVFPPRRDGGRVLVDGGVIDNLPLDVMAARFDGAIVASDVNLYDDASARAPAHHRRAAPRVRELAQPARRARPEPGDLRAAAAVVDGRQPAHRPRLAGARRGVAAPAAPRRAVPPARLERGRRAVPDRLRARPRAPGVLAPSRAGARGAPGRLGVISVTALVEQHADRIAAGVDDRDVERAIAVEVGERQR
ncbi:MAG TPA: patatin-like phospholipase family protein [Polyangiaceae bacterium]|nr:patatin-like phospholipase family protein [Polyangiaceae bacterium]